VQDESMREADRFPSHCATLEPTNGANGHSGCRERRTGWERSWIRWHEWWIFR